jgi:UDP-glucose 4-epimerase
MLNVSNFILITGGAGYIGSHTTHFLVREGVDPKRIVIIDNLVYGHKEHLPSGVIFIEGDLCNKSELESVFLQYKIEVVIHFAAYAYVGESMSDPSKYFTNNITGGLNLLETMRQFKCNKIVFSSSCATYGHCGHNEIITEEHEQNPINPYGETKLIFEKFLFWYCSSYDIQSVSLRYFNAAGADFGIGENHNPETHIIPLTINAALPKGNALKVFGNNYSTIDGTCVRDFIHVTDLARAHFLSVNYLKDNNSSTSVNLGTGTGNSVLEIIYLIEEISNQKVNYTFEEKRKGDADFLVASNSKAFEILNWKPEKTIENIIESAWSWHTS